MEKVIVQYIKMPFETNLYRKNQKVWIIFHTGDLAKYVCGRYKGCGRYIRSYINYDSKEKLSLMEKAKSDFIEVDQAFADNHGLLVYEKKEKQSV